MWEVVKTESPHFSVNSVLPDFVMGVPLNLEQQGYGPAGDIFATLWRGGSMWRMLYPGYMIDAIDNALLHVGALLHPDFEGQRIFGYAHMRSWTDFILRLRKLYPDHEFPSKSIYAKFI